MPTRVVHLALLTAQFAATWPVWTWYVRRMADGSDEPWGTAALVTAAACMIAQARGRRQTAPNLLLPVVLLAAYALTFPWLPPLLRAAMAVTALGCTASALFCGRTPGLGLWGLLLLALQERDPTSLSAPTTGWVSSLSMVWSLRLTLV